MTNQEIYELMARFDQSSLTALKVTRKDFCVELSRGGSGTSVPAACAAVAVSPPAADTQPQEEGTCVTAPLVGTFYAAPAPGDAPFVQPGQKVRQGETLCLVEAMKTMNEIKAPCDCVVEAVLARDGELVSFGQSLVRYREG